GDHRLDDRGKGLMGSRNKQPQPKENRLVPDPLTSRVTTVEEANVIEWCDRCFLPHSPCDVDQEVEEVDDDETYDDVCMMESPANSQQGETSTELISARTG
ncbi:hypothetical protein KI387_012949, partial [Taxus chinensis]